MQYPTVINNFRVYNGENTNEIVGTTGEITLPALEPKSSTINGAGILGDIEETIIGQFGSTKMDIPFRIASSEFFGLMRTDQPIGITIRGAVQGFDTENSQAIIIPMKVVVKGKVKSINPGTLKAGEQMNASISLELTYIKIEYNGEVGLELDKLNSVYTVNGVDMLADIREYL